MKKFLLISLVLLPIIGFSQNKDFRVWLGASATKTWNKKYIVSGGMQARFDQNATNMYRYLVQGRFQYKVSKLYKIGANYRISDWGVTNTQRIDLDNFLSKNFDKENLQIRFRIQRKFGLQTTLEDRFRIRLRYQHKFSKRILLYGKAEYFYTNRFNRSAFDMQRYTVGTKFRVALGHFMDVFYRYEFEQNVERPETRFLVGVNYFFKMK